MANLLTEKVSPPAGVICAQAVPLLAERYIALALLTTIIYVPSLLQIPFSQSVAPTPSGNFLVQLSPKSVDKNTPSSAATTIKLPAEPNLTLLIFTTEKDAIRLKDRKDLTDDLKEALYYLPVKVKFLDTSRVPLPVPTTTGRAASSWQTAALFSLMKSVTSHTGCS